MAVAHDAVTMGGEFSGASPHTVNHTPTGTPKGVLVFISQGGTAAGNDTITGVTYGGTAMTRVATNGWAADTAGEAGSTFAYFLGSSVPTGAQDCVVSTNGGSALKWVYVITLTGAANLEVVASGRVQGDTADPSVTLDSGATSTLRYGCIYSGHAAPTSLITALTAVGEHDFGNYVTRCDRQTLPGGGSSSVGYTALSDDVAMIGVAIGETAGGLSATIAQASETNTAQAVGRLRALAITQASSTDTALALGSAKSKAIGQAVDTSSATAVVAARAATVGQAAGTDVALAVTAAKRQPIGQATDTSSALALSSSSSTAIAQAAGTDSALAATRLRALAIGQPSSTDTALGVSGARAGTIGQASGTDTALPVTPRGGAIGQAADTSSALPLGVSSTTQIGQAAETNTTISVTRVRTVTIGVAAETSSAGTAGRAKVATVGAASGTDSALVLTASGGADVGAEVAAVRVGGGVRGVSKRRPSRVYGRSRPSPRSR